MSTAPDLRDRLKLKYMAADCKCGRCQLVPVELIDKAAAEIERLEETLKWYGENARLCRLVHREGDIGRHALNDDGGKRARAALAETPS